VGAVGVIKLDGASQLRRSRYLPLLGSVVLEKHPQLRTVALESALSPAEGGGGGRDAYSLSGWHVLAGDPSLRTSVLEHGLGLTVDLSESFWNSRRGDERKRLTEDLLDFCSGSAHQQQEQEQVESCEGPAGPVLLCDMTAGVGALAVRLASRAAARSLPVRVIANDWNPHAAALLSHNRDRNSLSSWQLEVTAPQSMGELAEVLSERCRLGERVRAVVLDAPRPEGISSLLRDLRPLLQAHRTVPKDIASHSEPLRVVVYAMTPPDMMSPAAWETRLAAEFQADLRLAVASVVSVKSVGKGWQLVCVSCDCWRQI
jgi:tRNA G37 N-methylase Trm5